jgi:hypothetical protein
MVEKQLSALSSELKQLDDKTTMFLQMRGKQALLMNSTPLPPSATPIMCAFCSVPSSSSRDI